MKGIDRFDLLQTFLRIAETGSLTAAAASLDLTQPTVSRQLRQLEALLDVRLLDRTTQRQALTEEGRAFLADARRLLADWDETAERLAGDRGAVEGVLRVIAPIALGQTLLVETAARLARVHPGLAFDWILTDGRADLVEHGADCLIRIGAIDDDGLVQRRIARARRFLVAAPGAIPEAEGLEDPFGLAQLPALIARPFHGARMDLIGAGGARHRVRIAPRFASDNIMAVHRAALTGLGFALLPGWLIEGDLVSRRLVRILPGVEGEPLPIMLGYPSGRRITARLRAFVNALRGGIALP